MKQFLKKLVLCAVTLALCCNLVPMAFAADVDYYNITLDLQGGACDEYELRAYKTGSYYRLEHTPTPTLEGYTFDGWYDEDVGGKKITRTYRFEEDTTIYAHWTPAGRSTTDETKPLPEAAGTPSGSPLREHFGTVVVVSITAVVVALTIAQAS